MTANGQLELAKKHLSRVQQAWDPPDWPDLAMYGFYCLENAVVAAALHTSTPVQKTHPSKAAAASQLSRTHGLPDVSNLLVQLNDARKSEAYGDVVKPDLDPEDLVTDIEEYVTAVEALLAK
jgi:hypothetical protein